MKVPARARRSQDQGLSRPSWEKASEPKSQERRMLSYHEG